MIIGSSCSDLDVQIGTAMLVVGGALIFIIKSLTNRASAARAEGPEGVTLSRQSEFVESVEQGNDV